MTKVTTLKYQNIAMWLKDQPDKKDLRGVLLELRRLMKGEEEERNYLAWLYDVGTCVERLVPKGNLRYGENVIELLANDLQPDRDLKDWTLPNVFYRAREFVGKYKNRNDAEKLSRKRNADNKPLTRLHVSVLLTVKDDAQREDFLKQCLKESWSGQRLRCEIQNATGRKRGTGGRAPSPPKYSSAGVALRDIAVMANRLAAFHKVWYIGLRKLPVADQDRIMLREIEHAKKGLESVREDAREALQQVAALERKVKSTLASASPRRRVKTCRS
jgi:hypothetical protein